MESKEFDDDKIKIISMTPKSEKSDKIVMQIVEEFINSFQMIDISLECC